MSLANLLFLAGMVLVLTRGQGLLYGATPFTWGVLVLPPISAALTGVTIFLALIALRRRFRSPADRLHCLIVGLVEETETNLAASEYESHIHEKGQANRPLDAAAQARNRTRRKIRARVEHVFGDQENSLGGKPVRTIGLARAEVKIGLMNLTCNFKRYLVLIRPGTGAPAVA